MTILIVSVSKVDNLEHFLETWFSLLERQTTLSHYTTLMSIAWRDENRRILQTTTNWVLEHKHWVSRNKHFLYLPLEWIMRHNLCLMKNKNHSQKWQTVKPRALACTSAYAKLIKKDQQKVFYLKVWKIDSVFLLSLTFELSKLFLYLSRYVFTCFTLGSVKATA